MSSSTSSSTSATTTSVASASSAKPLVINVDVVSDTICPWCFIGKRRLEAAMKTAQSKYPQLQFQVRWWPFLLDPSLPKEGVDKLATYKSKFGEARVAQMLPFMTAMGQKDSINFSFGGMTASTIDSHRLVEYAFAHGGFTGQNKVMEELFKAYFEQQQNIGDNEVLATIGEKSGLKKTEVLQYLQSNEGKEAVLKDVRNWASRYRITGVPFFIINNKFRLSGAQDPASFYEIFEEIIDKQSSESQ